MNITNEQSFLSSSASTRTSLEAIRNKHAGLTQKREKFLARVPNSNDWAAFNKDSISIKDIAYLAAGTGDEFALLRGKTKDIVFHGVPYHCHIDGELLDLLKTSKIISSVTGIEQTFSANPFDDI